MVNCFSMRNFYPNTTYSKVSNSSAWPESNVFRDRISLGGCFMYVSAILQGSKDHDSEVPHNGRHPEILQKFRITL